MFKSLSEFYLSKEWRSFRRQYIAEMFARLGKITSEYSGKEIVNTYEIILHHKTELTLQNVNDFSISLNPENILLVTLKEHNEIHSRFGYSNRKKVYYVYGAPCSGKTTFVNNVKGNSDLIIDVDNIWQCITAQPRYTKPEALKSTMLAVRNTLIDVVKTRSGNWQTAYYITGGEVKGIRERELKALGAEEVFINTDKDTCIERLYADETRTAEQKREWKKFIDDWFNFYSE